MVLATDKKLGSKLVDKKDGRKLEKITPSCGFVYSGVGPDYRVLVQKARKQAQGGVSAWNLRHVLDARRGRGGASFETKPNRPRRSSGPPSRVVAP